MNFGIPGESDDDEYMWKSPPFSPSNALCSGLHDFESTLRCPICIQFLHIPVSLLPCHHAFCSECIRTNIKSKIKGMNRGASCPVCRVSVSGDESKYLVPNRVVEQVIVKYKALRGNLKDSLSQFTASGDSADEDSTPKGSDQEEHEPKRRRTTRFTSSVNRMTAPSAFTTTATKTSSSSSPHQQAMQERLKTKRATHYSALKRKDLVALCAKEGLSTKGTDRELRARHEEFVKLYNAQCDSFHPQTHAELVREVTRREENRKVRAEIKMYCSGYESWNQVFSQDQSWSLLCRRNKPVELKHTRRLWKSSRRSASNWAVAMRNVAW